MNDIAISVENISKEFRTWKDPAARLKAPLLAALWRRFPRLSNKIFSNVNQAENSYYNDFRALQKISFKITKGESIGIVGRNGSGKSTLLQIIAGTLQPTTGKVVTNGRIAALLELGSGFNPEFTGRENVYLNGSVLGLTREEMNQRFREIEMFADIGSFIEQPVKTYSSGMLMRLAFAVQVAVEPDILIVDEALSVGDVFFTQKCFSKLREIQARGTSLLFVSHDTAAIQNLCDRALLLEKGLITYSGSPEDVTARYFESSNANINAVPEIVNHNVSKALDTTIIELSGHNILKDSRSRMGDGRIHVISAVVRNESNQESLVVEQMKYLCIDILMEASEQVLKPEIGFHLYDRMNNLVFAAGTPQLGVQIPPINVNQRIVATIIVQMSVQPGQYTFSLNCGEVDPDDPNLGKTHDRHDGLGPISVWNSQNTTHPFYGIAQLDMSVNIR